MLRVLFFVDGACCGDCSRRERDTRRSTNGDGKERGTSISALGFQFSLFLYTTCLAFLKKEEKFARLMLLAWVEDYVFRVVYFCVLSDIYILVCHAQLISE